jgi:hypothetical protein
MSAGEGGSGGWKGVYSNNKGILIGRLEKGSDWVIYYKHNFEKIILWKNRQSKNEPLPPKKRLVPPNHNEKSAGTED